MRVGQQQSRTARVTSFGLAILLGIGAPGPGLTLGAAEAAANSGTLSVETDPDGATVIVDDRPIGSTPMILQTLPPGEHRVRVVKDSYLDNSRVVKVAAGQAQKLQLKLTRNTALAPEPQVDNQQQNKGGGGSKKWIFIGLGAAAVGGGAYYLATKNAEPNAGTIAVSPTGTGMAGVTNFTFRAQGASDPDNDPLTFAWDFGDGSGSGETATHVYGSPGTFTVKLTVKDKKHSVEAPVATVTVARSMAGLWTGGVEPIFSNSLFSVNLAQNGTSLSGTMTFSGSSSGSVSLSGSVNGTTYPATVTFVTSNYNIGNGILLRDAFSGTTDGGGTSMSGTITLTLTGAIFNATGTPSASGSTTLRR